MAVLDFDSVTPPFKKHAKYGDLYSIPDGWTGEIIDGDLYAFPRPRSVHARAITRLLVPDLAGWRRARMPVMPDLTVFKLAPDWVCEGLSPSSAWLDKGRKREVYAKAGVGHLWFADPALRSVDALELDGKSYRAIRSGGCDERITLAPFGHPIELAKLWQR